MNNSYIIAIDFGTAYSGFAFSLTARQAETEPLVKYWGAEVGQKTVKTPTCILFDESEAFMAFGYEAQKMYFKMRGGEAKEKFYFECFKMSLYGKKLDSSLTITAANGRSMEALKVFTEALKHMKDEALKEINSKSGKVFIQSDFTWVLTVPAIWDPSAKQFMREAASQAGIVTKGKEQHLVIALEPEAASVWCKKLPADGFISEGQETGTLDQSPGTQYTVVDCGGGTVDITVHQVLAGGALKELHKASGNDMGGQTVDRKFKEFLKEIFGDDLWEVYEQDHPGELQRMMYEFTISKRHDDEVNISCPYNLSELAREKGRDVKSFLQEVRGVSWNEGCIQISKERMRSFFNDSLRGITNNLKEILQKGFKIQYILLVGGYGESQTLRRHVTSHFGGEYKVLCPLGAQEAIVKGAVMFGGNPAVISSRKSAYTYGIAIANRFEESKHREDKKMTTSDGVWCEDIFCNLVEVDQDVDWDQIKEKSLYPVQSDQVKRSFRFYRSERKNPEYVDEWGVEEIGAFVIDSPNTTLGLKREAKLKIKFGFTEMTATATDVESGSTETVLLDFMRKS